MNSFLSSLEDLYSSVPRTTCDNCGECCTLSDEEVKAGFATMYPLYAVEYVSIADHVSRNFDRRSCEIYFGVKEEQPMRCPFRDEANRRCVIYSVRPMTCRTYGVLSHDEITRVTQKYRGIVPNRWLDVFMRVEKSVVCPRVRVVEKEKIEGHVENLICFRYIQGLVELSIKVDILGDEKRRILREVTGLREIIRWTWGGYNLLRFASVEWMRDEFAGCWRTVRMVDR